MKRNHDSDVDATGFVFRDQDADSDKCTWSPSVRGTNGAELDDHWESDGICPGTKDNADTVPVCAAGPYWEDKSESSDGKTSMKFDCGYEDSNCSDNTFPNRCDPTKVGQNVEGYLNSLPTPTEVGIIEDDGTCKVVDGSAYNWKADSDNHQIRVKKTSCPYYKSGDQTGCKNCKQHKLIFMPIKGTLK